MDKLLLIVASSITLITMSLALGLGTESPYFWWNVYLQKAPPVIGGIGYKMYGRQSSLELKIILKNEGSDKGILLPKDFQRFLNFRLKRGDIEIPPENIVLDWAAQIKKVADPSNPDVEMDDINLLEPEAHIEMFCTLRRADNQEFDYGEYRLMVSVTELIDRLKFEDQVKWWGRAGREFQVPFTIFEIQTLEDLKAYYEVEGSYAYSRQQYMKALEHYQKLIEVDPTDIHGYSGLGAVYLQLKQFKEAARALEKVLPHVADERTLVPYSLAYAYVAIGDEEKAIKTLKLVLPENKIREEIEKYKARLREFSQR